MPETAPPAAGGPAQREAPFGSSPATGPTPNRGYEAAAGQRLGVVLKQLEAILPLAGSQSEMGKAVMKALDMLGKHVPAGSTTPAAEKQSAERMMMNATQNRNAMQQMRPQGAVPPQAAAAMPGAAG